jgi:hypothetical protein
LRSRILSKPEAIEKAALRKTLTYPPRKGEGFLSEISVRRRVLKSWSVSLVWSPARLRTET